MGPSETTAWLGYGGILLLVLGTTVGIAILVLTPGGPVRVAWQRYEDQLESEVRFLFYDTSGKRIARMQLLIMLALGAAALLLEDVILVMLLPLVALAPRMVLRKRHEERVAKIEKQLDSWLLILANALKATPSLGEAIASSAKIIREPISQEVDLLLKEVQLGTPLDQAVIGMSNRIGSRSVSGALATILVGRQTGGELPRILEESASTLREMSRLEGVVRTKTAEGKSQAYVLGVIPFLLIAAIHMIDPNWLRPLTETTIGFIVILVSMTLWIGAIFAARRILTVDI
jgi:tight adherence protein B